MEGKRGLLLLTLPIAAVFGMVATLASRRSEPIPAKPAPKKVVAPAPERNDPAPTPVIWSPAKPSAPAKVASAAEQARLRGTYRNFRTAVASGNAQMQKALARAFGARREAALRIAEDEVERARTARDREIARMTLDALRRQP